MIMIMSEKDKKAIIELNKSGDVEKALIELQIYRMKYYQKLTEPIDRFFLDYCMAHIYNRTNNVELARQCLGSCEEIFNTTTLKITHEEEYIKFLWLKTNIYKKEMDYEVVIRNMVRIYRYYEAKKVTVNAIAAKGNLEVYMGNKDRILDVIEELIVQGGVENNDFLQSALGDCEKISHNLYIKALGIIKRNSNI